MFGRSKSTPNNANTPSVLASMRIQTSAFGQPIRVVYGTQRVAGTLIYYNDFVAIPHTTTTATGGKGGGGGQKQTSTTYTYQAAVAILLAEGTVYGLLSMWDTKGNRKTSVTTESYTIPSSPFQITVALAATFVTDLGVTIEDAYSQFIDDFGSDGGFTASGFQKTPKGRVTASPITTQYSVASGVYTFAASDVGQTVHITYSYAATGGTPSTAFGLTVFTGTRPQTAWGYLTTNHPSDALGYTGFAYVANAAADLGESGELGNLTFEITGLLPYGGAQAGGDSNPRDVINDIVTNQFHGVGMSSSYIDANTSYSNFCIANGFFFSPVLETQQTAATYIDEICKLSNSAALWSQGVLKILPYGDTSLVGNGATYIADTQPRYALTVDDFIVGNVGEEPIIVTRANPQDAKNAISIEWSDRSNSYNFVPCEAKDAAHIDLYGLQAEQLLTAHMVTQQTVATAVCNHLLKRSIYIDGAATYAFKLSWKYCLLEPMDVITLAYAPLFGASAYPVRIKEIDEDEDGLLTVTAEEFPFGAANPVPSSTQSASGYDPQQDADPIGIGQVMLFEPNNRATEFGGYEMWLLAGSTDVNFGGCNVYASQDGTKYAQVGKILRGARMGLVQTATYPSHADPDNTDTLHVNLVSNSGGALTSASASDNDAFKNLAIVGGELISFQTATLVGANQYDLTNIHRGVYGTSIGAHGVGEQFCRLDDCLLKLQYAPEDIGKTIHFKFACFNTFGARVQSLAACTDYPITIGGVKGTFDGATGMLVSSFFINPVDGAGVLTGANPLSQHSTATQIDVASFTMQFGAGTRSYNSGSVDPLSYGAFHVTVDDPTYSGGALAFSAWPDTIAGRANLTAAQGRLYLGKITTAGGGGGGGTGGGDLPCVVAGTPITLEDGTVIPVENAFGRIVKCPNGKRARVKAIKRVDGQNIFHVLTHLGKSFQCSGSHTLRSRMKQWFMTQYLKAAGLLWTIDGDEIIIEVRLVGIGSVYKLELEPIDEQWMNDDDCHVYCAAGVWSHNAAIK